MTTMIALVTIEELSAPGGVRLVQAGSTISDAGVQAAYLAAGGFLALATDPVIGPQAAIVQKLRNRGANEDTCTRMMLAASGFGGTGPGEIQRLTTTMTIAQIQAQTTAVAFKVGGAPGATFLLPANTKLMDAQVTVGTALSGGGSSAVACTVQGGTDAAGSIIASHSVFTGANPVNNPIGSNFYPNRGGQQLFATLTATGAALSALTAGALTFDFFYAIVP